MNSYFFCCSLVFQAQFFLKIINLKTPCVHFDMVDVLEYSHILGNVWIFFWHSNLLGHVKHIQSTLVEHVKKKFTWIFYEIFFHVECSCSPNNILVSYEGIFNWNILQFTIKNTYGCFNISHKKFSLLNKNENLKVCRFCILFIKVIKISNIPKYANYFRFYFLVL
jgi:hypothetical protein